MGDLDIYQAANFAIARHGADALIEAGRMVDRMLQLGAPEGQAVWRRIRRVVEALHAQPSGAVH
jgi:hypothetical protein